MHRITTAIVPLLLTSPALCQFEIKWSTIDCGGLHQTLGQFDLQGTVGQTDASGIQASDGTFEIVSGFWAITRREDCIADFNHDGNVNLFDFLAFQTAYGNEDAAADLAPPFGVFNLFDFLAFQTVFGNGC